MPPTPSGNTGLVPPADLGCPECGAPMVRRESRYGLFYGCSTWPACTATHGCRPNGMPLGRPGGKATREARIRAHRAFDTLWQGGGMTRSEAYRWLRSRMRLREVDAHIGSMDIGRCEELIALINARKEALG